MLTGIDEPPDHLEVQAVRDDDADHLDVGILGNGSPVRVIAFVTVTVGNRPPDLCIHIADGDVAQVRERGFVECWCDPVGRSMGLARHTGSDDGDSYGHASSSVPTWSAPSIFTVESGKRFVNTRKGER